MLKLQIILQITIWYFPKKKKLLYGKWLLVSKKLILVSKRLILVMGPNKNQ